MSFSNIIPTQFEVSIQGNAFTFGALPMKSIEGFVKEEAEAADKKDFQALVNAHRNLVVAALNRAKDAAKVTLEEIEELDRPLFNALFGAIIQAHGMKPDAKVGEAKPQ